MILNDRTFSNCFRNSLTGQESGYRVYVAGPISDDALGRLPAFFDAEDTLRGAGHTTFNPARVNGARTVAEAVDLALEQCGRKSWAEYMREGVTGLMRCNAIALLPDWWQSRGATLEQRIASELRYAVINLDGTVAHDVAGQRTDRMPEEFLV